MALVGFKARNHPQQEHRPDVDDRSLPVEDFAPLNERFRFSVDVAASANNTRLTRYYTIERSGLEASWESERVYCNPPYSDIRPWVEKAHDEVDCDLIVMLLPANRTEQGWWQVLVEPYRDRADSRLHVEFLPGRIRFIAPGRKAIGPNERPPFGSCLLIWSDEAVPPLPATGSLL